MQNISRAILLLRWDSFPCMVVPFGWRDTMTSIVGIVLLLRKALSEFRNQQIRKNSLLMCFISIGPRSVTRAIWREQHWLGIFAWAITKKSQPVHELILTMLCLCCKICWNINFASRKRPHQGNITKGPCWIQSSLCYIVAFPFWFLAWNESLPRRPTHCRRTSTLLFWCRIGKASLAQ